jgi:hypothetical protein
MKNTSARCAIALSCALCLAPGEALVLAQGTTAIWTNSTTINQGNVTLAVFDGSPAVPASGMPSR